LRAGAHGVMRPTHQLSAMRIDIGRIFAANGIAMKRLKSLGMLTIAATAIALAVKAGNYDFGYAKEGNTGNIEGTARDVVIHSCNANTSLDRPGYCNGTLRVDGKKRVREVIVTSRVAIVVDGKSPSTLDSFTGAHVKVSYVERDGLNYATSVVATTASK